MLRKLNETGRKRACSESARRRRGLRVDRFLRAVARAADAAGFEVTDFGDLEAGPLYALVRAGTCDGARIYLSSGMHGDEPAGPLAVLKCLRRGELSPSIHWHICPVLNPTGLRRGTRENEAGRDMNRDYQEQDRRCPEVRAHIRWLNQQPPFDMAILMHEDSEANGFYLNEFKTGRIPGLDERVLRAVASVCPIDPRNLIDGMRAERGIVHPFRSWQFGAHWPESFYLRHLGVATGFNFETPSTLPLRVRLTAHRMALREAVRIFLEQDQDE